MGESKIKCFFSKQPPDDTDENEIENKGETEPRENTVLKMIEKKLIMNH